MKRARGRIERADARAVVIAEPDAPPLTLRVAPGTTVTLDGRPSRAEALPAGAEVRAAYRTGAGGRPTALEIEASNGGGTDPPAANDDAPPPARWDSAPPDGRPVDGG